MFDVKEFEMAPEWDGHTDKDVKRLESLSTDWTPLPGNIVHPVKTNNETKKFIKLLTMYEKEVKVFLGGTCNESTWREKLIPMLTINYFNPVVEDWTPACQEEEYKQKEICDIHLYVITPKMTGVFSIAELIDSSNKNPKGTVFMILSEDEDIKFNNGQLRSLHAVANLAENINGAKGFFDDLPMLADYLNQQF
jgi:hypothetical protein